MSSASTSASTHSHIFGFLPSYMKFDPLLCKDNLKRRWQEIIFESREAIVKLISTQIKKGNKGLVENVIRPRATTLVLRLVAHFGTHCVSVPDHCRTEMPSFCSLVFDNSNVGVVHAYCKVITEYVCFLLEEQKGPTKESTLWLPRSLMVWVNDATDKTKNSVRLMPTITLAKPSINQSEDQSMCVSELLVSILENPDDSLSSIKQSIEDHCHQFLQLQQQNEEEKKQKKQGKGSLAQQFFDSQAHEGSTSKTENTDDISVGSVEAPSRVLDSEGANALPAALSPVNKQLKYEVNEVKGSLSPESKGGMGQHCPAATGRAPSMHDGLQLGSAAQLSPSMHTFLMRQLSLNHGALPNALVNVVETGVQFMAEQRFGNDDPSLLRSFNEPERQAKRRKINVEHMGHIYVLIEKLMTLHAEELDRQFQSEERIDWKNATGDIINVVVEPRSVYSPSELICIGNQLLGTAHKPTFSSAGQKQEGEQSITDKHAKPATTDSLAGLKQEGKGHRPADAGVTPKVFQTDEQKQEGEQSITEQHDKPATTGSLLQEGRIVSPLSTIPAGSPSPSKNHNDCSDSFAGMNQEGPLADAGATPKLWKNSKRGALPSDKSMSPVYKRKPKASASRNTRGSPPSDKSSMSPVYKANFPKPNPRASPSSKKRGPSPREKPNHPKHRTTPPTRGGKKS